MTITETLIGGCLLAIFTGLLGFFFGDKDKITHSDMEVHRKDPNPHTNCPVHTTEIQFIKNKLDAIDVKVDKLLER